MIKDTITKVVSGRDLTEQESARAMEEIMTGAASPAQIGAFLTALRMKGETTEELTGAARVMRAKSVKLHLDNGLLNLDRDEINIEHETILDTCGTGGDGTRTFNVSTTTAFVAAGAGVKVAKHGNRAVSSRCGSADVLEALGVNLDVTTTDVERCIGTVGIGFLYAPLFHGSMKYAANPRRQIGIRSIFNLLGPLTNPAGASVQVLGVYDRRLTGTIAAVLERLGTREAFVVCGEDTFDEISICGGTTVSHLKDGTIRTCEMTPEQFGMRRAPLDHIRGGGALENARIVREVLGGARGAKRDMVLLNGAAALVAAGKAADFEEGIRTAAESIDSGRALEKLDSLVQFTRACRSFSIDDGRTYASAAS